MKSTIVIISMVCVALIFGGCSKTQLTQNDLTANNDQAIATKACYDARKIDYTNVPKDAIGYIVMSKQFSDALLAVTGNDPCQSTNVFDVQIAEVESKNRALTGGFSVAGNLGMFYLGADVLKTAFDAAGSSYSFAATDEASINLTDTSIGNTNSLNTATSTNTSTTNSNNEATATNTITGDDN